MEHFNTVVIGGGIVGLATAYRLQSLSSASVAVIEAEGELATHQTGRNSGVIHSGLYYKPGSLKATLCASGRDAMYDFCARHSIPHERCGKVVVATTPEEIPRLDELERRGRANGLTSIRRASREEICEREPNVSCVAGFIVEETGIVSYPSVARQLARLINGSGGSVRTNAKLLSAGVEPGQFTLETSAGPIRASSIVNCAGLQCDRVAKIFGVEPNVRIVPFRGEYYDLLPHARGLVKDLIYPVPDPAFPFLGVHFTRAVDGTVEAGPNAVLAMAREGYDWETSSWRDLADMARYPGFWKLINRHWRTGMMEARRSLSKELFLGALRKLIPDLGLEDITPGRAGVRAQAVEADGGLVDDFRIIRGGGMVHVLNAPSPAATASLAIGATIADIAAQDFHQARK
ncbi:MAG: L-2-hydroxyglutarate oxidase [Phycisphaerales bacterium]|nr:MAG: L-2-hydroxyglutarate oxidase [Phycisphaerales bacterium]